jgi:hypothetical protein
MIVLDVEHIFALVGGTRGPRKLINLLNRHVPDNALNYPAVQMWLQRGRIPGRWVPPVIYALLREGQDPMTLFTDDGELWEP